MCLIICEQHRCNTNFLQSNLSNIFSIICTRFSFHQLFFLSWFHIFFIPDVQQYQQMSSYWCLGISQSLTTVVDKKAAEVLFHLYFFKTFTMTTIFNTSHNTYIRICWYISNTLLLKNVKPSWKMVQNIRRVWWCLKSEKKTMHYWPFCSISLCHPHTVPVLHPQQPGRQDQTWCHHPPFNNSILWSQQHQ